VRCHSVFYLGNTLVGPRLYVARLEHGVMLWAFERELAERLGKGPGAWLAARPQDKPTNSGLKPGL
jgi:hypothetical protein